MSTAQPWPAIDAKWPVIGQPKQLAKLYDKVDELDTAGLTAFAKSIGITPPEVPGSQQWPIVPELTGDEQFICLVWDDPDEDATEAEDDGGQDWPTPESASH